MARLNLIEGVKELVAELKKRAAKAAGGSGDSAVVGYTANYALYVHEDLNARHAPGKQAKYLEQPYRELKPEIPKIIRETYKATGKITPGLLRAALRIQRESQLIVPVDTGNLKASAFTRLEKG